MRCPAQGVRCYLILVLISSWRRLSAYARAMRCPGLTERVSLLPGFGGNTHVSSLADGTLLGNRATRLLRDTWY
eukprot:2646655-Rhodomonas_salina.1